MRTKLLLAAVACLLLFTVTGLAQQDFTTQEELIRDRMKTAIRSVWDGRNADRAVSHMLLHDPEIRSAWGISDAQYQQIEDAVNDGRRYREVPNIKNS